MPSNPTSVFVRDPARFGAYHMLSNAPRRLVELALTGVKLPLRWVNEVDDLSLGSHTSQLHEIDITEAATTTKET